MTGPGATAALQGGVALLERAINYTLGNLHAVPAHALAWPTPCCDWDLRALLVHLDDSLAALAEAADDGLVSPASDLTAASLVAPDLVTLVRDRAQLLLGVWTRQDRGAVRVGEQPLPAAVITGTGAIEVAVHGWDIGQAVRAGRALPESLAERLLELAPFVVTDAERAGRFDAPLSLSRDAGPADQLLAFLGRRG